MSALGKNWKALLALLLIVIAFAIYQLSYVPARDSYELEKTNLNTQITVLQTTIAENQRYESVQEELEPATEAIEASRQELYSKFPVELREEDQIMYMLYLEEKFDKEVVFSFAEEQTIQMLSDGSELQGSTITFDYETTYAGFKKMVEELATDPRITSVRYATFNYDTETDTLTGQMTVTNYLLKDAREYVEPSVTKPSTGKTNPFKD